MKNVSLYEQLGILIPGAVLLFGIILLVPGLKPLLAAEGVTVGGLGLYLVLSYPLGHLIASLGNVIEKAVWPRGVACPRAWDHRPARASFRGTPTRTPRGVAHPGKQSPKAARHQFAKEVHPPSRRSRDRAMPLLQNH